MQPREKAGFGTRHSPDRPAFPQTRFALRTLCAALVSGCIVSTAAKETPIQIELFEQFASFVNPAHSGNRIGYRFHEHTPLIFGDVPQRDPTSKETQSSPIIEQFQERPGAVAFHRAVTEEGWIPQDWTFHLAPVADGIELLLVVKTASTGLPEYYGVQQCFRLTGNTNQAAWRHKYARTPDFSEYDLWNDAPSDADLPSLTWVLRKGALQQLPPGKDALGCRTPYGQALDSRRSHGQLDTLKTVGPYQARMLWTSDSGPILRTSLDQKWSTGLYWERTTHLTDHHPADCLHAIVNIGGIPPHSQRVLRGKIYWLAGSGDTLLEHWRKDFGF